MFTVDYSDEVDTIVSGSADSTLRIWKMSSGQCLQTRYGHSDWVIKVLSNSLLLCISCPRGVENPGWGNSHMNESGTLVVSLGGMNQGLWTHLVCALQTAF